MEYLSSETLQSMRFPRYHPFTTIHHRFQQNSQPFDLPSPLRKQFVVAGRLLDNSYPGHATGVRKLSSKSVEGKHSWRVWGSSDSQLLPSCASSARAVRPSCLPEFISSGLNKRFIRERAATSFISYAPGRFRDRSGTTSSSSSFSFVSLPYARVP